MRDLIVEEIHQFRREYAAKFNYDLKAICEDLRSREGEDGRGVVSFPPKRPKGWVEPVTTSEPASEEARP